LESSKPVIARRFRTFPLFLGGLAPPYGTSSKVSQKQDIRCLGIYINKQYAGLICIERGIIDELIADLVNITIDINCTKALRFLPIHNASRPHQPQCRFARTVMGKWKIWHARHVQWHRMAQEEFCKLFPSPDGKPLPVSTISMSTTLKQSDLLPLPCRALLYFIIRLYSFLLFFYLVLLLLLSFHFVS